MSTQKKRTGAADEVNVTNVKVLPISNSNTQLENGNIGTGNISTLATFSLPPLGKDFKAMASGTHNLGSLLFDETRTNFGDAHQENRHVIGTDGAGVVLDFELVTELFAGRLNQFRKSRNVVLCLQLPTKLLHGVSRQ